MGSDFLKTITVRDGSSLSSFDVCDFGTGRPVFAFVGGVHGNETSGMRTAERLAQHFAQHEPVLGTVRVMPRVNPTASKAERRCSPADGKDLNRCFPGDPEGSLTERIADALWRETADADFIIDLHGCDGGSLPYILTICDEFPAVRRLAEAIPMGVAVRSKGTGGQLFVESCRRRGQAALVIELPCANPPDAAEQCFEALMNLLRAHGVVEGAPEGSPPEFFGFLNRMPLAEEGVFEACVARGTIAERGSVVGLSDGAPVRIPERGLIMNLRGRCIYAADDRNAMEPAGSGKDIAGT